MPRPGLAMSASSEAPVPQTAGASLRGLINLRQVIVRRWRWFPAITISSEGGRSPGIHRPGFFYEQTSCFA